MGAENPLFTSFSYKYCIVALVAILCREQACLGFVAELHARYGEATRVFRPDEGGCTAVRKGM